jgi:hypothetical protein
MQENSLKLRTLALATVLALPDEHGCDCASLAAVPVHE